MRRCRLRGMLGCPNQSHWAPAAALPLARKVMHCRPHTAWDACAGCSRPCSRQMRVCWLGIKERVVVSVCCALPAGHTTGCEPPQTPRAHGAPCPPGGGGGTRHTPWQSRTPASAVSSAAVGGRWRVLNDGCVSGCLPAKSAGEGREAGPAAAPSQYKNSTATVLGALPSRFHVQGPAAL
jgi:hypothetical protein